ncbi:metal dependent phosphohydrolase [Mycoplasma wenyonii str. Massachusetts]|uniref:Metal dependent phosphohydrolase n=1 Tax=Mycoplasma wenyonii (strain Massachusetts) TaxID=1197325 RepID=I6ZFN0_MYCWM|nr:HD domain-containing protein [Mycoplasma wenyonii]AFN65432.1 metal dependent phosphohydrolase [Mycoplasma wenyonii str. Massachusetts]
MQLVYFSTYSIVYPEVLKTLTQNFEIDTIVYYKKELSSEKLLFTKKELKLFLKLLNPSITLEFQEIPSKTDLLDPESYGDYIESLLNSFPKDTIYFIETQEINHMKWKLERLSNSHTFILFTNKHKKYLNLSLGGQNWKRVEMALIEIEKALSKALKRIYKEQTISRFDHTLRVIEFAEQISKWASLDEKTRANLLLSCAYHDFAKNWSKTKLIRYGRKIYSKPREELIKECWNLHGPVAKYYLSRTNTLDDSILTAIEHHTKPIASLDIVGKVLVIADKLEPKKKGSYPSELYDSFLTQLKERKIDEVFKYLLENPLKS